MTPKEIPLMPGEIGRVTVRFDPGLDILQWLNKNADDMQLLANIWLSWSELATWQRIRRSVYNMTLKGIVPLKKFCAYLILFVDRVFMKYNKSDKSGPLSTWGTLYTGDIGVGRELKDNKVKQQFKVFGS